MENVSWKVVGMGGAGCCVGGADAGWQSNDVIAKKIEGAFNSRWRPALGWICVGGLFWQFITCPLLSWVSGMIGVPPPPDIPTDSLIGLVVTLLGLGGLRTAEKIQDVA